MKPATALDDLLKREPSLAAELKESSSYYRPLLERRRRQQAAPRLPCFFVGGHDWHWNDARRDYGQWFVKKSCDRCHAELDYQIGSASEDGRYWSSEGGTTRPPRAHWALRPYQHPQGRKSVGAFLLGVLLLGILVTVVGGLVFALSTLFFGLAQDVEMSKRPEVLGRLSPGLVVTASSGEYYWEESGSLPFLDLKRERYAVSEGRLHYRWQRCMNGGCHDISGAATSSYTIRPDDAGKYLRVVVKVGPADGKLISKDIPAHASKPRLVSRG